MLSDGSMLLNESVAEDTSRLCEALNISSVGLEAITSSQDHTARLQAAFLHFNKNNIPQAQVCIQFTVQVHTCIYTQRNKWIYTCTNIYPYIYTIHIHKEYTDRQIDRQTDRASSCDSDSVS